MGGNYEKPDTNTYVGVIADVVELFGVQTTYGIKNKIRIVWVLDKLDSQGKPLRVMRQVNAVLAERSDLYKIVTSILGQAPPARGFDTESLIGRANQLFVMKEKTGDKEFANVKGIMPLPTGAVVPKIPADFTRAKDRKPFVPNQPTQTVAASATQPVPAATAAGVVSPNPATTSAPAQTSNVAF
jgi:hypothetical protein